MRTLKITRGVFNAVRYTADGEYLVGLHSGWRLRVWATADFSERYYTPIPGVLHAHDSLHLSGDLAVFTRGIYSMARMWAAIRASNTAIREKGLIDVVLTNDSRSFSELTLSPDGQMIVEIRPAWGSRMGEILLRDRTGNLRMRHEVVGWTRRAAVAPDSKSVALLFGRIVGLYDLEHQKLVAELHHTDSPERALFSPDGTQLAVGAGRSLWLWDVGTGKGERFPAFDTFVDSLTFSPDGKRLAAADRTGEIRLLEAASGRKIGCLNFEVGGVHDLAFSPDGMTVAGATHDNAVVVWDLE